MHRRNWGVLARTFGRGCFPHQFSWLIDNPLRSLLIRPGRLAERLRLTAASSVLELGCGSGFFSLELARRVPHGRLELLDLQPGMLQKAKRKLEVQGFQNVGYWDHDASAALPFPDRTFDVAVAIAVLGEVLDQKACLGNLYRVLGPGSLFAVHEHIPDPDRIRFADLRPLVELCGFTFRERIGSEWNYTALFKRS